MNAMLSDPLMQRALLVALAVGLSAPVIGTYLVQRRLSLMGDGIGHVALTGVAAGWLAGNAADVSQRGAWAVPGAVILAVIGAVIMEKVRSSGTVAADVIMAVLFYGGIAGGVLLIGVAGGSGASLMGYLFGSISTVSSSDVWTAVILSAVVILVGVGLRSAFFSASHDPEFARSTGLPTNALNMMVAIGTALVVTVSMRVVGLLLVSALMILPVAIAQLITGKFSTTMGIAMGIGATVCVTGLSITYFHDLQPGALIVMLAIGVYIAVAFIRSLARLKA